MSSESYEERNDRTLSPVGIQASPGQGTFIFFDRAHFLRSGHIHKFVGLQTDSPTGVLLDVVDDQIY